LLVKPGDKLSILLINDLPANPKRQRKGFFPHDPYTLNLHTHGLEVSPLGISDNIFREMKPGTAHQILVDIPADHPTGTFWYHPHKHGSVTFQFLGGMAGFLLVKGGKGTLDGLLDDAGVKDLVMGFQIIRTTLNGGVPAPFVNEQAEQFGTYPFDNPTIEEQGIWSTYAVDGAPGRSFFYYTTNGVTNPTLHMRPGEVQRWRLLNASEGDNLLLTLEKHGLNIVAMDGITVEQMYQLKPGDPIVMGPGQRIDVLVKAGDPGTYKLLTRDPVTTASVSPYRDDMKYPAGIDPEPRSSRHSFDFPTPCSPPESAGLGGPKPIHRIGVSEDPCDARPQQKLAYPFPLATIMVDGAPIEMDLPAGHLPVPKSLPSDTLLKKTHTELDAVRHVAFEICAKVHGTSMENPDVRLPSCGWYFTKYDAEYWGGAPLIDLLMMRDDDDKGKPSNRPDMPLVGFKKDGLFNPDEPLFRDMIADHYEEWTVINRSFSDHPFHIHQNPVLVTKINNITLPRPEWHDTLIVPGAIAPSPTPQPTGPTEPPYNAPAVNINTASFGSITFRTHFDPNTVGCFVMHCHTLTHEDIGMMQRVDVLPARGKRSGCVPEVMEHSTLEEIDWPLAGRVKFPVCAAPRQSEPTADGAGPLSISN